MELLLFKNFSKKLDSTARPNLAAPDKKCNVELKQNTSYKSPVFTISDESYPQYSYAYITELDRYYFVKGTSQGNRHFYELSLELDKMATAKTAIGNYTCYIERTSDARYYNPLIADSQLSAQANATYVTSAETQLFTTTGAYVVRMVGRDSSGIATFAFNSLGDIGHIFNPVFTSLFDNGDWTHVEIGDYVQAFLCDPTRYLVGAYYSPIPYGTYVTHAVSDEVCLGFYKTGHNGQRINDPIYTLENVGLSKPASSWNDFRKYDANFSSFVLYLPAVGAVQLSSDIIDDNLSVDVTIDLLTGDTFYKLKGQASGFISSYKGNCYAPLQIGNGDPSGGSAFLSNALETIVDISGKNVAGAITNGVETVRTAIAPTPSINGSQGGVADMKGQPNIVIGIIQRASAEFPVNQVGRPCCKNLTIGNLSGFVKCGNPSLSMAIESEILDEINAQLSAGFYYE